MADTKISALPTASTPLTGSEVVPLNQSGVTSNVTVANLTAGRNVYANNFIPSVTTTTASSTPINLTVNSTQYQTVNGTTTSQQFNLPDATTLSVGDTYYFNNNLTVSSVQVNAHDGSTSVLSLQAGGDAQVVLLNNSTTNGTWDVHSFIPSSASWGTATLSFNNTTSISGSVSWTGTKIGTAYGGTGLSGSTPFTANGIVYASSTSALATGSGIAYNGTTFSTSNDASINGLTVGKGASSVSTNTAVGVNALTANSSGASNTAVGYQAGYSNQSAGSAVCIGAGAGYTNVGGGGNTFVGANAGNLFTATSGATYNAFFGAGSGSAITSGQKNTIVGGYSGNQGGLNITASNNYIVLSDGDGNPRGIFDSSGNLMVGQTILGLSNTNGFSLNSVTGILGQSHITGTSSGTYYTVFGYNGSIVGSITQSGTTAVLYNVTSDQRLKENIVDAPDASADIDAIKIRSFDFISDKSSVKYGFIAQELVTVAPDAVHQPSNPEEMMGVDYSKLVPMMLKEIQSLRARLKAANIA